MRTKSATNLPVKSKNEVQTHCIFHSVDELFKFLAEYLGPVALGNIGVKIGKLGLA